VKEEEEEVRKVLEIWMQQLAVAAKWAVIISVVAVWVMKILDYLLEDTGGKEEE